MMERTQRIRITTVIALLMAVGCVDMPDVPPAASTASSSAGPGSSTGAATSPAGTSGTSTTEGADAAASTEPTGATTAPPGDVGTAGGECDVLAQECPPGQKCMPWADDGGTEWNAARCVPVADDPAQVGEPCQAQRSPMSGLDDCALGAMCWYLDPETLEGTCVSLCMGSEMDGVFDVHCEDPQTLCRISSQPIYLCLPVCDPLAADCPPGQGCYPSIDRWECAPDESRDGGAYGDPCEFTNACDPGLVCLDASAVPPGLPCEGGSGCCTEVCDLDDPAGDMQCAGAAAGQVCTPWFSEAPEIPLWDDLGICTLPQ